MQVETYEVDEVADETAEMAEEAIRLIDELALEGQRALIASPAEGETRIPYRQMNREEMFVYETLCPESCKLTAYRAGPIPVRVLQVASHASGLGCFKELRVWASQSQADPDPVLVAETPGTTDYTYGERFILARWGETLDEWPALCNRAVAVYREKVKAKLAEISVQVAAKLQGVDALDFASCVGHSVPTYYG